MKKSSIVQHLKTKRHRENKQRSQQDEAVQEEGLEDEETVEQQPPPAQKNFNRDLCKALISSNIPLNKVNSTPFSSFLLKYTAYTVPDQSTLRKYHVQDLYKETLSDLRHKVDGKKLWVSLDETTDVEQRYVACFVFGILGEEVERLKCYLGNVAELKSVNHSTIAAFFNDSLHVLWPQQILYENVLIATTDAAPYMCKAMRGLQVMYPKMIHVTCLAHGLHRVAEMVRSNYPEVNRLISAAKSVFLKSPRRVEKFKELSPGVSLPPSPVVTRWGTWLEAAQYYSNHLEEVNKTIMSFDETEAQSIAECRELLNNVEVKVSLAFIANQFSVLASTIEKLETRGLSLKTAVGYITEVKEKLENMYDRTYFDKFTSVLAKNKGFATVKKISSLLSGKLKKTKDEYINQYSSSELTAFQFAPVVTCDVERMFSVYKTVLADNRRSFHFENLKHHLIIKCNEP